jgi:hypothetical protein
VWLLPAPQTIQKLADISPGNSKYLPTAQLMQTSALAFAGDTAELYFPLPQSMQATSMAELYLPVAQAWQSLASSEPVFTTLLPASHVMQTSLDWATLSEYLPAPQSMQTLTLAFAGDAVVLYLPALQSMQATSVAELYLPVAQA